MILLTGGTVKTMAGADIVDGQVLIDGILRDRYAFVKEYGADGDYKLYERL